MSYDIRWDPNNSLFTFYFYVKKEKEAKTYQTLIPNEIISRCLGNSKKVNDLVETCVYKLGKINFRSLLWKRKFIRSLMSK